MFLGYAQNPKKRYWWPSPTVQKQKRLAGKPKYHCGSAGLCSIVELHSRTKAKEVAAAGACFGAAFWVGPRRFPTLFSESAARFRNTARLFLQIGLPESGHSSFSTFLLLASVEVLPCRGIDMRAVFRSLICFALLALLLLLACLLALLGVWAQAPRPKTNPSSVRVGKSERPLSELSVFLSLSLSFCLSVSFCLSLSRMPFPSMHARASHQWSSVTSHLSCSGRPSSQQMNRTFCSPAEQKRCSEDMTSSGEAVVRRSPACKCTRMFRRTSSLSCCNVFLL